MQGQVAGRGGSKWTKFLSPEDSSSVEEEEEEEEEFSQLEFSEVLRTYGRSEEEVEIDVRRAHQQHGHIFQRDQGAEVELFKKF